MAFTFRVAGSLPLPPSGQPEQHRPSSYAATGLLNKDKAVYAANRRVVRMRQRMEKNRKRKREDADALTDELLSSWSPSDFENILVSMQVLAHLMARVPCVECGETLKTAGKSAEGLSTTIQLRCSSCRHIETIPLTASAPREGATRRKSCELILTKHKFFAY